MSPLGDWDLHLQHLRGMLLSTCLQIPPIKSLLRITTFVRDRIHSLGTGVSGLMENIYFAEYLMKLILKCF